jgi:raffinose/stachyose/melibiose transport system substrate-binding protein
MTGRSFTRRGFLGISVAAVAGAGLTACTGTAQTPAGGGDASAPTTNELRIFTYEGDETIDLFKAAIAKFDQQAGTKTAVNTLPGSGAAQYPDKLRTELLGGAGPDVWRIWGGELGGPFARAKQALDLAPYYEKFGWNNTINTTAIEGMTFDGMKAGVPFISLGMGGWYNKALFEKAGISAPPTSYEELEEANDKLLSAGTTPLATGGKYGWHVMRLFEYLLETAAGPELHDKLLKGEESWDRPEVVTAFTNFKKWQDQKWMPEGALGLDPSDIEPSYVQGKTAYTITGPWTEAAAIQTAKKDEADFGVFQLPTGHTPARHSGFVEGYMINAKSGNPEKAAELAEPHRAAGDPEGSEGLRLDRAGRRADPKTAPLAYEWSQGPGQQPFYTVQDQAFPKQQSDQYFAIQSDILQGKVDPAGAAKRMQDVVSAWAKK